MKYRNVTNKAPLLSLPNLNIPRIFHSLSPLFHLFLSVLTTSRNILPHLSLSLPQQIHSNTFTYRSYSIPSSRRSMAGNDWINSYLEAILDVGPGIDEVKSSLLLRERGRFSPTRYFVEEVITGFDETDLHRSWLRVYIFFTQFLLYVEMCVCTRACASDRCMSLS